jgi:hypothetical protein
VLGPGADVPAQRHRVAAGVDVDVAVVLDYRVPIQCVLHESGHVCWIGVGSDLDLVPDVADAGKPGNRLFGRLALPAELDQAGQDQVAVTRGGVHAFRDGDVQRQRIVRRGGQPRVVAVVGVRQHNLQVVVHALHAGDPPRGGGGLQILWEARHSAVERYISVHVHDMNVRVLHEWVELELCFDCLMDVFGAHLTCVPSEWRRVANLPHDLPRCSCSSRCR